MDLNSFSIKSITKKIKQKYPQIKNIYFYEQYHPIGSITNIIAGDIIYNNEKIYFMKVIQEDEFVIEGLSNIIEKMQRYLNYCIEGKNQIDMYLFMVEALKAKNFVDTDGLWPTVRDSYVKEQLSKINQGISIDLYNELMEVKMPKSEIFDKAKRLY